MRFIYMKGFSLIELAVVLGILGLVLGGALFGLGELRGVSKQLESQATQENIKQSLLRFGVINKYLPCPDTTGDGDENRTSVAVGAVNVDICTSDFGGVPYLNIGLQREEVQDAYGNFIRYAVNQDADDGVVVVHCNSASSASYFCNDGVNGQAVFTLEDTPPLAGIPGAGNYIVCNEDVAAAACGATTPANQLLSASASVVLVAYNEDGAQPSSLPPVCGATAGASLENCDTNDIYHQARITSDNTGVLDFFDDTIVTISGYEIKSALLSPITVWTRTPGALFPTYVGYDLDAGDYVAGVNGAPALNDSANPDVIRVNRNITTALNLGAGDDHVTVGNDLASELVYDNRTTTKREDIADKGSNAELDTGSGNDTVYIVGAAHSNVLLGSGDDHFVLGTNLTETLKADVGNDNVWIQGGIESGSTLTLDEGNDVLWLGDHPEHAGRRAATGVRTGYANQVASGTVTQPQVDTQAQNAYNEAYAKADTSGSLSSDIDGGADYDILVLENMTKAEWDADGLFQSRVVDFELVIFSDEGSGVREHCVYSGSSCN